MVSPLQRQKRRYAKISHSWPTRNFSWLKPPTSAFTLKNLLRHFAKQVPKQSKHGKLIYNRNTSSKIIIDRRLPILHLPTEFRRQEKALVGQECEIFSYLRFQLYSARSYVMLVSWVFVDTNSTNSTMYSLPGPDLVLKLILLRAPILRELASVNSLLWRSITRQIRYNLGTSTCITNHIILL